MKGAKNVRCKKCYKLLCKRLPIHVDKDEGYIVHVKQGKLEVYAYDVTIICPSCQSGHRVNGELGLIEKELTPNG
jgi:hypothetical protein